jgi:deoxyribonuclease I
MTMASKLRYIEHWLFQKRAPKGAHFVVKKGKFVKKSMLWVMLGWLSFLGMAQADYPSSFEAAKREMWRVYKDHRVDQYCGCPLGSRNAPDLKACGYEPRKNAQRAARTEAEHVVPAENLGRQFSCWRQGGRDYCNAKDAKFRDAHNDLHNLIPVVGEVNGDRSNFRFDELSQGYGQYGQCQFKVDFANRRAEPPQDMKGDIARIHFYMRDRHGLRLSSAQEKLFSVWSRMDPVSSWERVRDQRIAAIQGNSNPYVSGVQASFSPDQPALFAAPAPAPALLPALTGASNPSSDSFDCSRKTCGAMSSCAEAQHKLNSCGQRNLDRDGDGVPCESLCR